MQLFSVVGTVESGALILVTQTYHQIYEHFLILNYVFFLEMLWVLTRKRKPSKHTISEALEVVDENNLSRSSLVKTEQENCGKEHGTREYGSNGNFLYLYF